MRRKYFFFSLAAMLMLLLSTLAISAQVGQLYGEVLMQQADGKTVPAAGATIDVYRTDISGKFQTKTDKNGKFVFAGLPFVGTYIVTASAPDARPDAIGGVKAGRDVNYKLTLSAADAEQPALLTNKSVALRSRGVERYNAAIKSQDEAAKTPGLEAAKQDFRDAAQAATKAVELIKAQTPPTDPAALKNFEANKYFALASRAEAMRLLVGKADPTQVDAGLTAYQEYIAAETAPDKKVKAQVAAAQMLL